MGIVVDLDAPHRSLDAEGRAERGEQLCLACVFRETARQRSARIVGGVIDQFLPLPALRHRDLDAPFLPRRKSGGEQFAIVEIPVEQDERGRGPLVVELRHEGAEHLRRRQRLVGARKIGAVAPVLEGAEEEHLDAELARVLVDREDVRLLDPLRIDALFALDRGQRRDPVAQARGALEFELLGRLGHLAGHQVADGAALSGQEIMRLLHEFAIGRMGDFAGAGSGAALDLVQEAGPRAVLVERVRAGTQQEGALQGVQRAVDRAGIREGAEIIAVAPVRAAMFRDLGRGMVAGDEDEGEGLVVPHQHVEARLQLLDEIGLEQQRLGLGAGRDEDHVGGQRDHPPEAVGVPLPAQVAGDALAHALRLADIEHRAVGADHPVDAGAERRVLPVAADDGDAARDGALGRRQVELRAAVEIGGFGQVRIGFGGIAAGRRVFRRRQILLLAGEGVPALAVRGFGAAHGPDLDGRPGDAMGWGRRTKNSARGERHRADRAYIPLCSRLVLRAVWENFMSIFGTIMSKIFGTSAQAAPAPGAAPAGGAAAPAGTTQTASTGTAATGTVDVGQILGDLAAKNPQKLDWKHSIVDLMKLLGMDSSLEHRKELAKELHYDGDMSDSASMNIWLSKQVMKKLAENGGKLPDDLKNA